MPCSVAGVSIPAPRVLERHGRRGLGDRLDERLLRAGGGLLRRRLCLRERSLHEVHARRVARQEPHLGPPPGRRLLPRPSSPAPARRPRGARPASGRGPPEGGTAIFPSAPRPWPRGARGSPTARRRRSPGCAISPRATISPDPCPPARSSGFSAPPWRGATRGKAFDRYAEERVALAGAAPGRVETFWSWERDRRH